jgi:hypothetical protein
LVGKIEENHGNRIGGVPGEIRTGDLLNTSRKQFLLNQLKFGSFMFNVVYP